MERAAYPWGIQDDSRDGGGGECLEHILEVERNRTNIGNIRVKMPGAYFPDRVECTEYKKEITLCTLRRISIDYTCELLSGSQSSLREISSTTSCFNSECSAIDIPAGSNL